MAAMRARARSAGRIQMARRCVSWNPLMGKSPRHWGYNRLPLCGNPSLMPIFAARVKRYERSCSGVGPRLSFHSVPYDFDRIIERRNTESNKWHKYPPDVLPLWVADMDFASPEPVIRALRERVEHGVFGYGVEQPELHQVMQDRFLKRFGWTVEPDAIVLMPGVTPGNNTACRAFGVTGDGVLMQLPVYPPILRLPDNVGMSRDGAGLVRG